MPSLSFQTLSRRRLLISAGTIGLLGGCSQMKGLKLFQETLNAARAKPEGADRYPRSRAEVDALPYAQLGVRIGDGQRGIMVLAEQRQDQNLWLSANRLLLVTEGNRIARTDGLRKDLRAFDGLASDPFARGVADPASLDGHALSWNVTVRPGDQTRVPVESTLSLEGEETIEILDRSYRTIRVREDLSVAAWRWRSTNRFWLSTRSPLAWRSVQQFHPDQPAIEIEVLKRAA